MKKYNFFLLKLLIALLNNSWVGIYIYTKLIPTLIIY